MKPGDVASSLKKKFGNRIKDVRIEKKISRAKKDYATYRLWLTADRKIFRDAVRHLCSIYPDPHFSACSGYDLGKSIELIYHFTLNYATRLSEFTVSIKVSLPKSNPVVPTITGLIPGALISEREMQEMLGVKIEGIPDTRRLFLDRTFPADVYPWRRDEKGPQKLVRNLNEEGKP